MSTEAFGSGDSQRRVLELITTSQEKQSLARKPRTNIDEQSHQEYTYFSTESRDWIEENEEEIDSIKFNSIKQVPSLSEHQTLLESEFILGQKF